MKLILCIAGAAGALAFAQSQPTLNCNDSNRNSDRHSRSCTMREQTIPYSGQVSVDGNQNGGVSFKGSNRGDVLVRMRIETYAPTEGEAAALASQVRTNMSAGRISSDGPTGLQDRSWSVSYEVFVPEHANIEAKTNNGGIHISDVNGTIEFSAVNGGIHLSNVGGKVHGQTKNGGVHVQLAGSRWEGEGMDVTTVNGGVHLAVPANYSAKIDAATTNGAVHNEFASASENSAVRAPGERRTRSHTMTATLGNGGPTLHLVTTNGGVHVGKL